MMNLKAANCVWSLTTAIPAGRVMSYGQLAKAAGLENPRQVGFYLHHNPDSKLIPCHRVVGKDGRLSEHFAFGGLTAQKQKLAAEGVQFSALGTVLPHYFWQPHD